jgi:hypothetical protein
MSYHSLRHPEEFDREPSSPFDPIIPTSMGCLDCGEEMTVTDSGDFICLNCKETEE